MCGIEYHRRKFPHDGERTHVDDEIVVSETRASFGDEDFVIPAEWHFSTTCFMSHGETNWPFLMFTTRSLMAAATTRSVWRQRNAGICRMSATSATLETSCASCTSVSTGTCTSSFTFFRMRRPSTRPGPRKLRIEVRFALS